MLFAMTGVVGLLITLGVRFVGFGFAFWLAARKNPKVLVPNKWALPLIALVFAVLNTVVYSALMPILNLATLGALGFAMPLVANLGFLLVTIRIFRAKRWLEVHGSMTTIWMALVLTAVHGALWLALDYIPRHV